MTVVETAEFLRKVTPLLSESERMQLVAFIASAHIPALSIPQR